VEGGVGRGSGVEESGRSVVEEEEGSSEIEFEVVVGRSRELVDEEDCWVELETSVLDGSDTDVSLVEGLREASELRVELVELEFPEDDGGVPNERVEVL